MNKLPYPVWKGQDDLGNQIFQLHETLGRQLDCISHMFKFSHVARKVMYTTNAIKSLNSGFLRLNRSWTVFPNAMILSKALYLATWKLTEKWILPVRNWEQVYAELNIVYLSRLTRG